MEIEQLNKILEQFLNVYQLNEMARIGKYIEINNEDVINQDGKISEKFPHFHWLYNRKIHFKFANRCPKNASELRKMIAFPADQKQITDQELTKLIKILKSPYKDTDIYNESFKTWKAIHPTRDIYKDIIIL